MTRPASDWSLEVVGGGTQVWLSDAFSGLQACIGEGATEERSLLAARDELRALLLDVDARLQRVQMAQVAHAWSQGAPA